ncbi:hypothetical protein Tco_1436670, partial [Tanacetum coccineum]
FYVEVSDFAKWKKKQRQWQLVLVAFVTHYERALEEMYGEDTENSMCEDRLRIIGQIEQDIVFDDDDDENIKLIYDLQKFETKICRTAVFHDRVDDMN